MSPRETLKCQRCGEWSYADSIHTCSPPKAMSLQEILEAFYKLDEVVHIKGRWADSWFVWIGMDGENMPRFVSSSLEECRVWLEKKLGEMTK